ncbi:MAG: hypothetical protein JO272_16885 [Pseudonocardiales bacterium]|nr:hypothetical protein [Pseudonocardiales bacterium]
MGTVLLYSVGTLSIATPLLKYGSIGQSAPTGTVEAVAFANYILIVSYYVINIVTETFVSSATARLRRAGFIDSSLGSKFLGKDLTGYFSSDSMPPGHYKLVVNCFENCFFAYNIAKEMTRRIVIKNVTIQAPSWLSPTSVLGTTLSHSPSSRFYSPRGGKELQDGIILLLEYETTLAYNKSPLSDRVYEKLNEKMNADWEELKQHYAI